MGAPIAMQTLAFDPADAGAALAQLPQSPAVFALYGEEAHFEPYVGRTPNLRGRLARLLQPSPKHPRRLQLAGPGAAHRMAADRLGVRVAPVAV